MALLLALLAACDRPPCEVVGWADADGDGAGDPRTPLCRAGGAPTADDCDDGDPRVYPGAPESCDGVDQDCDGWPDDRPTPPRWLDRDGDGWGSVPLPNCDAWGVDSGGDCDDDDPFLNPHTPWFHDQDGDGVGDAPAGTGCEPPSPGAVRVGGDCDDDDPLRSPSARETCDPGDEDCDPSTDSSEAWLDPTAVARLPIRVRARADVPLAVALDAPVPDPGTVRVFLPGCEGHRELPAAFVPGERDPWVAGGAPPAGGTVFALWDEDGDLATVEPWPDGEVSLAVYWGGAASPPPPGGVEVTDDTLASGGVRYAFDAARGGALAGIDDGAGTFAGQAQATAGNGLRTSRGPLSIAGVAGAVTLADEHPVTAALGVEATAADADGAFAYSARWRLFAGRPVALARVTMVAAASTVIEGTEDRAEPIRPLQLRASAPAACEADPALGWGDLSDADRGVTWAWVAPPRWVNVAGCGARDTWTSANDLAAGDLGQGVRGTVDAGQAIVDGAVLALLPHGPGGPGAAADQRSAWAEGPLVTTLPLEE